MVLIFFRRWLYDRMHAEGTRVQAFHHALDCAAFSRRIRSLEDDDHGVLRLRQLALDIQKLELLLLQTWLVFVFRDRLVLEIIEAFASLESGRFDEFRRHV
jgi:hypothetical protein